MIADLFNYNDFIEVCYNHKEISKKFKVIDQETYTQFLENYADLSLGCSTFKYKNSLYLLLLNNKYVFIDTPLVNIIKKLNENGFKTHTCCCGHKLNAKGYIAFNKKFSDEIILIICQSFWKHDYYIK